MAAVPKLAHKGLLSGLFEDGESAEHAYQACLDLGYEIGEVNVIVAEGTRQRLLKDEEDIKARLAGHKAEGGELGGPSGGRAGMLLAIVAAVGAAVAIPAVGFIAGPAGRCVDCGGRRRRRGRPHRRARQTGVCPPNVSAITSPASRRARS